MRHEWYEEKSQMSILHLDFKVVDKSTANMLNLWKDFEKNPSSHLFLFFIFLKRVFIDSYQIVLWGKQHINSFGAHS